MSVLARRRRDEQFARERELVAMRDAVVLATTAAVPAAGSSATLEAVDEALAQLVSAQAHLGETEGVKAKWIKYARCRLLDEQCSSDARLRDATAVDEHSRALAVSVSGDPDEVLEDDRQSWRVREILSVLHGEQRKWAEAWYREVLSSLPAGAQPRGLPDALGWTTAKTEKTSQRARRSMGAFVTRRQNGEICTEQRALLDGFVTASSGEVSELLEHDGFEAIVFHVVGCEDCWAAWHSRRRPMLARPLAILAFPVDAIATAAHSFAGKLAGLTAAATTSVLGRLGIGGAAAAGGGAATIGTKTAAVCVGVVCAATAGGEIAGVLPALHERTPKTQDATAAKPEKAIRSRADADADADRRGAQRGVDDSIPGAHPGRPLTARRTRPRARTTTTQAPVIPGDLPVARAARSSSTPTSSSTTSPSTGLSTLSVPAGSSPTASSPSSAPSRSATSTAPRDQPDCVPGDLGC